MTRPRRALVVLLAVALAGCGVTGGHRDTAPPPPVYDVSAGHVVRTPASSYLEAVNLTSGGTGVLVGRHTVLSAAHADTTTETTVQVTSDARVGYLWQAKVVAVTRMPGYVAGSLDLADIGGTDPDDLALLRLSADAPAEVGAGGTAVALRPAVVAFDEAPVQGCTSCLRHVGFGVTNGQGGDTAYQKHSITTGIDLVGPTKLEYGQVLDGTYVGTCHGYSGGPGYAFFHGVEKVAGIVNAGDEACRTEAWDIRMDRADVKDFVQQTLAGWDDCGRNPNCPALAAAPSVRADTPGPG